MMRSGVLIIVVEWIAISNDTFNINDCPSQMLAEKLPSSLQAAASVRAPLGCMAPDCMTVGVANMHPL